MPIFQKNDLSLIQPEWAVSNRVHAFTTTRLSGNSEGPYSAFNLATHVEDDFAKVQQNRQKLNAALILPSEPSWLNQQHTTVALEWRSPFYELQPIADAVWTRESGVVLTVMTADCLPILLTDTVGSIVVAIHAGWRGLADGIIEQTLAQLPVASNTLTAWIGPAISQKNFEVGGEVLDVFVEKRVGALKCFKQSEKNTSQYYASLPCLADFILKTQGVSEVVQSGLCTYEDEGLFYSYRRDGITGRMASLIWLE